MLELLEMRLDNIIFRLNITPTIIAARQLISHKHVYINNATVSISSYQCKAGDTLKLSENKYTKKLLDEYIKSSNWSKCPEHLNFNKENLTVQIRSFVDEQVPDLNVNKLLVIEYYSRKI